MTADRGLILKTIEIMEAGEQYEFRIFPMLRNDCRLVLSEDEEGLEVIGSGSRKDSLKVKREKLEALPCAYVRVVRGEEKGNAVRILTRPPEVLMLRPKDHAAAEIIVAHSEHAGDAKIDIVALRDDEEIGSAKLELGVSEFSMSQVGIICLTETAVRFSVTYATDTDGTAVFSPPVAVDFVVNPPKPVEVRRKQGKICLTVSEEPVQPLYLQLYKNGREFYDAEECVRLGEKQYEASTEQLNLDGSDYSFSCACKSKNTVSYWTKPLPLVLKQPRAVSTRAENGKLKVRLAEEGFYFWEGQYIRTTEVEIAEGSRSEICYADRRGEVNNIGMPLCLPEKGFYQKNAYFWRDDRQGVRMLKRDYTAYENDSFAVERQDGGWRFRVRENCGERIREDFRSMLGQECTEYAQLEELCCCFDEMPLRKADMLPVRYGYLPEDAACDIHEGMLLCLDPGGERKDSGQARTTGADDIRTDHCFEYLCILRDGKLCFAPFVQDAEKCGALTAEPPAMDSEGKIAEAAGMADTFFGQFPAPFARLIYPALHQRDGVHRDEDSFYYDHVCIITADSYKKLEEATECFRNRKPPLEDVAYVSFGSTVTVELKIRFFADGQPQTCPLGTTLGDVRASYGMEGEVRLERLSGGVYYPMVNGEADIPLYRGDRVCRR